MPIHALTILVHHCNFIINSKNNIFLTNINQESLPPERTAVIIVKSKVAAVLVQLLS